jgi:hypothetical protein
MMAIRRNFLVAIFFLIIDCKRLRSGSGKLHVCNHAKKEAVLGANYNKSDIFAFL